MARTHLSWHIARSMLVCLVGVLTSRAAWGAGPADEDRAAALRSRLNHVVYRDREQQLLLRRARQSLTSGQIVEGLRWLQKVLDGPDENGEDSHVWSDQPPRLSSIHHDALQLINSLDPTARRTYQRLFGPEARRLLADAKRSGTPTRVDEVIRRYFATSAGFNALNWQASRWLDHGQFSRAARSWDFLASSQVHRNRLTGTILLKAALAYSLSGQKERADQLLRQAKQTTAVAAGRPISPTAWLAGHSVDLPVDSALSEWRSALGNAECNANSAGTVPYLEPRWSVSVTDTSSASAQVDEWVQRQLEKLVEPMGVANYPIAVGHHVIVRDFRGIRARDLRSGELLWEYCGGIRFPELMKLYDERYNATSSSFDIAFAGNATFGMMASDGQRLYAVEFVRANSTQDTEKTGREDDGSTVGSSISRRQPTSRLIALAIDSEDRIPGTTIKPVWVSGNTHEDDAFLRKHFFLGAPLPIDGCLYAITESNRQLNLVRLSATTGRLIWSQGIALAEIPFQDDSQKFRQSSTCTPSFADGVVVCPTDLGILVGVDAATGSLLWSYFCCDLNETLGRFSLAYAHSRTIYGQPGFPNLPHIHRHRIIHLPRDSRNLHCVDLQTGQCLWKIPRQDALYVGAVTDDCVLLVGRSDTRGISCQDGSELWSVSLGAPSGRGVRIGQSYLVPLKSGRIANIEIQTGQDAGFTFTADSAKRRESHAVVPVSFETIDGVPLPQPEPAANSARLVPGNLIVCGDTVVSLGPQQLTTYPQAAALLKTVLAKNRNGPLSPEDEVLASELQLTLGNLDAAESQLGKVMSKELAGAQRRQAEGLLRELLYIKLDQHLASATDILQRLDRLALVPQERARYLIHKIQWQLAQNSLDGLFDATVEFSQLDGDIPLPLSGRTHHQLTATSWLPEAIGQLRLRLPADRLRQIDHQLDTELSRLLKDGDADRLERFLSIYAHWPQAEIGRMHLARLRLAQQRFQETEFLLLQNRKSHEPQTVATATADLVQLWSQRGFHREAARFLEELNNVYGTAVLADGRTGREFVAQFPKSSLTWLAFQRTIAPERDISRVAIREQRLLEGDRQLIRAYGRYRRRFKTPQPFAFHLLEHDPVDERRVSIIDRETGLIVGQKRIPLRNSYQFWARTPIVGHFLVMGSPGGMQGLSLFDLENRNPLWNEAFTPLQHSSEILRPGPAGPTFCIFQTQQFLIALNPIDGRLMWQRSDVQPSSGLFADQSSGLFGDDQVLVLFDRINPRRRKTSYTVYRTATGTRLRRGELDIDTGVQRRVFGRRLFYVANTPKGRCLRIWDPLEDRVEWEQPYSGRLMVDVTPDNELIVVVPEGRLIIRNVEKKLNQVELDLDRDHLARLNFVRAFSDRERYYINLGQRRTDYGEDARIYLYSSDDFLPLANFEGEVWAVDRVRHEVLWKRSYPQRSFLCLSQFHVPFLIARSRVRNHSSQASQAMFVEVIDGRTGNTLAQKDDLLFDRMVHAAYDRNTGRITLHGLQSNLELLFDAQRQRIPTGEETL